MPSKRNYVTTSEVDTYTDSAFTATNEMITKAEELIDAYVGYVQKYFQHELIGRATAGASSSITLETDEQNKYEKDYFKWCYVEIVSGTGEGQRRIVSTSSKAGVLTVQTAWDTTPDSDSYYKIYQLGKFPRQEDVDFYSESTPSIYLKSIPEAVKRATCAQVEYMQTMGANYFKSNKGTLESESLGDYSYTKGQSIGSVDTLIAPKAKDYLKGITVRTGTIVT